MAGMGKMTRKQEIAISNLLKLPTVSEAAEATGIGERTLWRWLRDPSFQEAYRKARREAVSQAVARLQRETSQAVEALATVMRDDEAPATSRVSAARAILELAIKAIELEDIEARVAELEKRIPNDTIHFGGLD